MWLRNCWQAAAFSEELGAPLVARRIADEAVLLFRTEAEGVSALEDLCPHRLVPLSAGRRMGDEIVCGYHGMRFGASGVCTGLPGRKTVPSSAKVRRYPTVERWGVVWIWLGEASLADPALLPDLHWLDDGGWRSVHGRIGFGADYRLINDNLLDLSHETFLHPSSIGNGLGEVIGDYPATVSDNGRVIRAERVMSDILAPPAFVEMMNLASRIDRHQRAIYMAPGINLTESVMQSRAVGANQAAYQRTLHLLTPETPTSTHYFYISSRNYRVQDAAIDDFTVRVANTVFGEDKQMLELQQASLNRHPGISLPRVAWSVDEAPVKARRMLDALIAAEQENPSKVAPPANLVSA